MFAALSEADSLIRAMVLDELRATKLPELIAAEESAAQELQDAVAALESPETVLAELEAELARAEEETRSWQSQAVSDDISKRVAAKTWFAEWSAELDTLTAKREAMERDIFPLRQTRDEAKTRLFWASRDKVDLELNISDPRLAYIGWGPDTDSFKWWETYFAARTLQFGRRDDEGIESGRLYQKALAALQFWCLRTGYRTTELSEKDALNISRYWDDLYSRANDPGPVPSGADIIAATHAEGIGSARLAAEQGHLDRNVTEDNRKPDPAKEVQRLSSVRGF